MLTDGPRTPGSRRQLEAAAVVPGLARPMVHDRVHFSLPLPEHDDRVLIGIFVGHLAT